MFTYHQPGTGPARAGMTRFHPYGRSYARRSEHRNAEAGPSTLLPAPVPYVGYPTLQPSGGMISETTADAKKAQPNTEEDKAPVSDFYCPHILHVIDGLSASGGAKADQAPSRRRTTPPPPRKDGGVHRQAVQLGTARTGAPGRGSSNLQRGASR